MESAEAKARREAAFRKMHEEARAEAEGLHGTADWVSDSDPAWQRLLNPKGIFLAGRARNGQIIRAGDGHGTIFGTTGSYKGAGFIIPNLLHLPGSTFVISPKGEEAAVTAQFRHLPQSEGGLGQEVSIIAPWGMPDSPGSNDRFQTTYDPYQNIDEDDPNAMEEMHAISRGIVIDESGDGKNGFFSDEARMEDTALSMLMFTMPSELRTFQTKLGLIYQSEAELKERIIPKMQASSAFGGALSMLGNVIAGYSPDMFRNVLSTLRRSYSIFVLSPQLQAAMRPSALDFRRMKHVPMTVYLSIPAERLSSHSRYLRLLTGQMLRANTTAVRPRHDVTLIADECASLGHMDELESGVSILRAFGVRLVTIWQDTSQIKSCYPKTWQTFIANSRFVASLGAVDPDTCEYMSKMLGVMTAHGVTEQLEREKLRGGTVTMTGRPLLTPDEVARLSPDELLLLFAGLAPIRAQKLRYFADREFRRPDGSPIYQPNPYHRP